MSRRYVVKVGSVTTYATLDLIGAKGIATSAPFVDPVPRWDETYFAGYTWTRPRQADDPARYVDWESTVSAAVVSAQAAAPTTPWAGLTKAYLDGVSASLAGPRILSFPKGDFRGPNYLVSGNVTGNGPTALGLGNGYATNILGFAGAGNTKVPGAGGAVTTISCATTATKGISGQIILINGRVGAYFGGFDLVGRQVRGDGVCHSGLVVQNCPNVVVEYLYTRGCNPGRSNIPPGETFGINMYRSKNAKAFRCWFDGRDLTGVRTCASPLGWNNCGYNGGYSSPLVFNAAEANDVDFVNVKECYATLGITSMLTFSATFNHRVEDYKCDGWAWGKFDGLQEPTETSASLYGGAGINVEQCGGKITYVRPTLYLWSQASSAPSKTFNTRANLSFAAQTDIGAGITVTDPLWDTTVNTSAAGMLFISWSKGGVYNGSNCWPYMNTDPKVTSVAGVQLIPSHQKLVEGGANQPGWNTKNKDLYMALSEG